MVVLGRYGEGGLSNLRDFVERGDIAVVAFDTGHATIALEHFPSHLARE